jgi:HK97 family phage major capsid protein
MIIKSQEELNEYVKSLEEDKIKMNDELVKVKEMFEASSSYKEEYEELKKSFENVEQQLNEVKESNLVQFKSLSKEERMYNVGKFFLAMKQGDVETIQKMGGGLNTGSKEDWKKSDWDMKAAPDLGTPLRGDAVTGSYLIPDELAREVLRLPEDPSAVMNLATTIPMSVRKISFPKADAGVTFSWPTNEVTAKTEKNPTFDSLVDLECETAAGWVAMTEEFREDSILNVADYISNLFREAWQTEFSTQVLTSSAAPFTGVLEDSSVNTLSMGAGKSSFSDVTLDDLKLLKQELDTQAKRNGSVFMMHSTVWDHITSLKDEAGKNLFGNPAAAVAKNLWGYPVITDDVMPDIDSSAASTAFIAFGNLSRIYHGDRVGMEFRLFNQTADTLVYDREFIRARLRQGFVNAFPEAFAILKTAS